MLLLIGNDINCLLVRKCIKKWGYKKNSYYGEVIQSGETGSATRLWQKSKKKEKKGLGLFSR